jgi:MtrB/PioB family decaheme-associated outer membrane protein
MKANDRNLAVGVLALAVQGALAAMAAMPLTALAQSEEPDVASLTNPTNSVEIGIESTNTKSAKFGEYNGLYKKGADLIGNVSVKGGDAYGQGSGTMRWSLTGSDLGTTSRELGAAVSDQGKWNVGISFDQLRHYITDSYQTPYQGSMGGNTFVLPSSFGTINTTAPGARSLTATQRGDFQTQDVYSERKNTSFTAGLNLDRQWSVKFDYNRLDQSGAKLIGSGTDALNPGPSGYNWGGERIQILMNPTDYKTDTYNLALNYVGDKGHFTGSYYASIFHDNNSGVSFSNPWTNSAATGTVPAAYPLNTMSTPPSNDFHQLNLSGGYAFTSATRLVGGLSYSRNTQNQGYSGSYTPGTMVTLPQSSLNGLVVSEHADLKLTNQTTKDLVLTAGMKYNKRDNQTASYLYHYLDLGGAGRIAFNMPESNKRTQFEFAGDYRIDARQNLHLGYEYDKFQRWSNASVTAAQVIAADTALGGTSDWGAPSLARALAYYNQGTGAFQVPESKENRLVANYRLKATDDVTVNAGYIYADRKATVNPSFYSPIQGRDEGFENRGYVAFFDASRKQNLIKAGVNWQATEQLNLGLNGKFSKDDYYDLDYGVQNGHTGNVNLDASYSYSENSMVSAYGTWQRRTRNLRSQNGRDVVALAALGTWTNDLTENDFTFGVGGKQKALMGGRLDLAEDLTYSLGKTDYSTSQLGPTFSVCDATHNQGCGALPTIRSAMTQFKITGDYRVDKAGKVVLGYLYQRLKADDYFYNFYQYGLTSTSNLPSNQQSPSYSVSTLFASYVYTFR